MNLKTRLIFMTFASFVCAAILHAASSTKEIFSAAEAGKLMGQPVVHSGIIGPIKDEDSPALGTHWTYRAKEMAVIVGRLEFSSAAEAKKYVTPEGVKKMNDEEGATITPESGVGEKAFWIISPEACGLVFLQGSTVGVISLGGKVGSIDTHKTALKAAAADIAARL